MASLLPALLLALASCGPPDPVLPGVPVVPLQDAPLSPSQESLLKSPTGEAPSAEAAADAPRVYQKVQGVYVDIPHFGGRSYEALRTDITDQLGPVEARTPLGTTGGFEYRFANGALRVMRGVIYMVRVDLPRPVTRTEALEMTGFPPYVERWRSTHREFRVSHVWDWDRIRMIRAAGYEDRVIQVEAWKAPPSRVGR